MAFEATSHLESLPAEPPLLLRVYGDSLSMPRHEDGITYRETYAEIVRRELADFLGRPVDLYNRSIGGSTLPQLMQLWESDTRYFGAAEECIIVQAGIVDCAPRPLGPRLRFLVGQLPTFIKRRIIKFLHDNRARILRSGLGSRFTSPQVFAKTYQKWLHLMSERHQPVFIINIAPTTPDIEAHSPGLTKSIQYYNQMIDDIVRDLAHPKIALIDAYQQVVDRGVSEYICPNDGHHITWKGHQLYAELIMTQARKHFSSLMIKGAEHRRG